jgi:hypothetical protein
MKISITSAPAQRSILPRCSSRFDGLDRERSFAARDEYNADGSRENRGRVIERLITAAPQTALTGGPAGGAFTILSCFFDHDT